MTRAGPLAMTLVAAALSCGDSGATNVAATGPAGSGGTGGTDGVGSGASGASGAGGSSPTGGAGAASAGASGTQGGEAGLGGGGSSSGMAGAGAAAGTAAGSGGGGVTGAGGAGGQITCNSPDVPGDPDALGMINSTSVWSLDVDSTNLYWTESGAVHSMAKNGGPIRTMVSDPKLGSTVTVIEPGYVHVNSTPVFNGATIFRLPADAENGTPETISTKLVAAHPLLKLGANLYANGAVLLPPGDVPSVELEPLVGGNGYMASNVVTDGTNLYWRLEQGIKELEKWVYDGRIRMLAPGAASPVDLVNDGLAEVGGIPGTVVASSTHLCYSGVKFRCYDLPTGKQTAEIAAPSSYIAEVRMDDPYVYFIAAHTACLGVWRAKVDGGAIEHLWDSATIPQTLALDADYVYWWDSGDNNLYRKHK